MLLKRIAFVSSLVAAGLIAISTAGAMSPKPSSEAGAANKDPDRCFDPRFVRNFMTIDDRKMIVVAGDREVYELKLFGTCFNLDSAFQIGIRSRGNMDVCSGFDATILYRDMGRVQECTVQEVRHLTKEEAGKYVSNPR